MYPVFQNYSLHVNYKICQIERFSYCFARQKKRENERRGLNMLHLLKCNEIVCMCVSMEN